MTLNTAYIIGHIFKFLCLKKYTQIHSLPNRSGQGRVKVGRQRGQTAREHGQTGKLNCEQSICKKLIIVNKDML